jgi:lysine 2,3-aminomutase
MALPRKTLRDAASLLDAGLITAAALPALSALQSRYAIALTPEVQARITAPDDPVGRQYIPHADEALSQPHELADPTADAPFTPIKGVVHRYPDRALLKPLLACPVYCRFCFRREHVGPDGGLLNEAEIEAALGWFAAHPEVGEVILTGGDPLMLSPRRLGHILGRLAGLPHIHTLRIHSRVPVAEPSRITPELLAALRLETPLYLCVHANHAQEAAGFIDRNRMDNAPKNKQPTKAIKHTWFCMVQFHKQQGKKPHRHIFNEITLRTNAPPQMIIIPIAEGCIHTAPLDNHRRA